MPKVKQFTVSLENRPGALGELSSALGARKVNIDALTAPEGGAAVHLIVDKPAPARKVFAERGWQTTEQDVVQVTLGDKPGALGEVTTKLGRAGINIEYAYTGSAKSAQRVNIFLGVRDVTAALKTLRLR